MEKDIKIAESYLSKQKATLSAEESNQMECNDRKRKRSPSPAEIRQLSPVPEKAEDEPDLDESAVILSWCKFLIKSCVFFLMQTNSYLTYM